MDVGTLSSEYSYCMCSFTLLFSLPSSFPSLPLPPFLLSLSSSPSLPPSLSSSPSLSFPFFLSLSLPPSFPPSPSLSLSLPLPPFLLPSLPLPPSLSSSPSPSFPLFLSLSLPPSLPLPPSFSLSQYESVYGPGFVWIYFISLISFGSIFMLNLLLGVLTRWTCSV